MTETALPKSMPVQAAPPPTPPPPVPLLVVPVLDVLVTVVPLDELFPVEVVILLPLVVPLPPVIVTVVPPHPVPATLAAPSPPTTMIAKKCFDLMRPPSFVTAFGGRRATRTALRVSAYLHRRQPANKLGVASKQRFI
jgi:hypothetical protein